MTSNKFSIRPIELSDIESVSMRCWDNREIQKRIAEAQGILGIGAWDEKNICVGQLHFYDVSLPDWDDALFPEYAKKRLLDWPLGWPLLAAKGCHLSIKGKIMGIACLHVGVLLDAFDANPTYFRRGMGTALLQRAVEWAKSNNYTAIIAHGGPAIISQYNIKMGCLPWTVYRKLGFRSAALEENGEKLPWWVAGWADSVKDEVTTAISKGVALSDICARLMVREIVQTE